MFPRPARPIYFSSSRCCPPDISSVLADHDEFFELPATSGRRVAYSGIRSLLSRIMFSSRHSRMGPTVLLSHRTQPLPASAGVFARDHADVTGQRFPIAEPQRI